MPDRPPKDWFERCVEDVAASGHAKNPAAVCGATWTHKTPQEKALTTALEEPTMAAKKRAKKKHPKGKKHGGHAKKQSKHTAHAKNPRHAAHKAHAAKPKHHRCAACGHTARHDHKVGCTHFEGKNFCPCRQRG
jgi:hypothetical protein